MSSATHVILYTVMPIFGCLLVLVLSLSPSRALLECEKNNSLGGFNPLPPCLFFLTNLVWVINGIFFKDVFVFFINLVMVHINFQLTIRAYRLSSDEQKREIEMIIHGFLFVAMMFGFVFLYDDNYDAVIAAYGWMCCAFNMTVFVPPIFVMKRIITETHDASTISAPFAIVGCFCTFFWSFYGVLISQPSIMWPNVFGLVLSVVQTVMTLVYPSSAIVSGADDDEATVGVSTSVVDASTTVVGSLGASLGLLSTNLSSKGLLSADSPSPKPLETVADTSPVNDRTVVKRTAFSIEEAGGGDDASQQV